MESDNLCAFIAFSMRHFPRQSKKVRLQGDATDQWIEKSAQFVQRT